MPGADTVTLESGVVVSSETGFVFVPGLPPIVVEVRVGDQVTGTDANEDVDRMIASLALTGARREIRLQPNDLADAPESCIRREVAGRLGRGAGGVVIQTADDVLHVAWPEGWSAEEADDRRFSIRDSTGTLVAREWDTVTLGGRGRGNGLDVCPNGVIAREEFNPAPAPPE
jgi:hypothetical protein